MRARLAWMLGLTLMIVATVAAPASAQPPEEQTATAAEPAEEGAAAEPAEGEGDPLAPPPPEPDLEAIERMLREDEEVLGGTGYAYDPGDRRDPFLSLLRVVEEPTLLGPRPDGVPGLLIDEIEVTGVFVTERGGVAQVQAADKTKSFLIHEGDRLYDGEVVNIRYEKNQVAEVVFRQDVRDPTAPKPFREVVKKLTPDSP